MAARIPLILLTPFFIFSCTKSSTSYKDLYEIALRQAEENRPELEKVIAHYQNQQDSLKLEAAYFLIANMLDKYTMTTEGPNPYEPHFDRLHEASYVYNDENMGISYARFILDSISANSRFGIEKLDDITNMTADYLIKNIDDAFREWDKVPWKADYSFDDFLEWVLPYRVATEPLEDWRTILLGKKSLQKIR